MRALLVAFVLAAAGCGGGPMLQNVPRPNPGVVAGVAAAAATAATIADPDAATRKAEAKDKAGRPEGRTVGGRTTVPADVLDRLDHPPADASAPAAPASRPVAPRP